MSHLDDSIEEARRLLEEALQGPAANGTAMPAIQVGNAGNVASTIVIGQQTQDIGDK